MQTPLRLVLAGASQGSCVQVYAIPDSSASAHLHPCLFAFLLCVDQQADIQKMVIKPVILTKGTVKLAIYGIGNIKDERLHQVLTPLP
jgi:hypothetical protein